MAGAVITLVLGGARSGKSAVAEAMVARLPAPVTYVATTRADPGDGDLEARIATHRERRPPSWTTLEAGASDLGTVLRTTAGTVLVDSLGAWVAGAPDLVVDADDLCEALAERSGHSVVVSDEVGLGVHPPTALGRRFRDALGEVNQKVASVAGDVVLVVAGRTLHLDAPAAP